MENASKALLIAAGIFLILLILSLCVYTYNSISDYFENKHQFAVIEQSQEFNARFENYYRDNLRGTEVISLMNRVIDYNANESYFNGTNYDRIRVTIELGGDNILDQFKYETSDTTSRNSYLKEQIDNTSGGGTYWSNDRDLVAITSTPNDLCELARDDYGIDNMTDNKLQLLSSNISNIIVDENDMESQMAIYNRNYRAQKLNYILDLEDDNQIKTEPETGKAANTRSQDIIDGSKELASQYYQYMQFKRACFDCTEMKYNTETNRVNEIVFKLQIDENGNVVFD